MSSSGPTLHSARLINSLRTHLETDLKILARVHYKNHSQHHLALFWRRVVEVDRVGRRLLPTLETGLKEGATHAEARRLAQLTSRVRERLAFGGSSSLGQADLVMAAVDPVALPSRLAPS